jgi:formate--tetrahydrofolate ligase
VVAVNRFPTDTEAEIETIIAECKKLGVNTVLSEVWGKGGLGGEELAREVVRLCESENTFDHCYPDSLSIEEKIESVVRRIYRGDGIVIEPAAKKQIARLTELGFGNLPVCIAKTQYSFSDDPTKLGAPEGFTVKIKEVRVSAGAGFIVVLTGEIMTMPGLPKTPAAERIDVDESGRITGLF